MISRCAYGRNRFHFHPAPGPLRQPNVTLTGRAAGYSAVILATRLQGERPGEAERDGKTRRAKDGVAGLVPVFSPLSLSSALAPGWKTRLIDQSNWYYYRVSTLRSHSVLFSSLAVSVKPKNCIFAALWCVHSSTSTGNFHFIYFLMNPITSAAHDFSSNGVL